MQMGHKETILDFRVTFLINDIHVWRDTCQLESHVISDARGNKHSLCDSRHRQIWLQMFVFISTAKSTLREKVKNTDTAVQIGHSK